MKQLPKALKKFFDEQELLRLAYVGPNGYPRAVPVWFATVKGHYLVGAGKSSPKWKAIAANPRVGWVIDGGKRSAYKGLLQWGRTEEIAESRERRAIYRALSVKYFGKPDHPKFVEIYGKVDDEETVYFRLVPEGGTWWEY